MSYAYRSGGHTPFQESAQSWKARLHLSAIKTPVLAGVCVLALAAVFLVLQGIWNSAQGSSFEIARQSMAGLPANKGAAPQGEGGAAAQGTAAEVGGASDAAGEGATSQQQKALPSLYVHVGGAVCAPGLYELAAGSRLQAAIEAAGGFREDAATDAVNLARVLGDGEQVLVPTAAEFATGAVPGAFTQPSGGRPALVNINTASLAELVTLPGIGEATAKRLIANRESLGPFRSPEDVMRIPGIGEKKYEQLVGLICV
ncbi:MAG: ComEA family DNA-binding protein [Coriobacteriaceae bacterium]|jgi:competence protein ComEA|nr:ComEA family DNA-binding protein [Coriobacteriaceae bacterium]